MPSFDPSAINPDAIRNAHFASDLPQTGLGHVSHMPSTLFGVPQGPQPEQQQSQQPPQQIPPLPSQPASTGVPLLWWLAGGAAIGLTVVLLSRQRVMDRG